ncbi:MAG: class I SAM-dependent methyltransferase [Planctomycetota bacterium]|jgi:ubiquinone/menaquinone biosynthesis C-methylase UbiE
MAEVKSPADIYEEFFVEGMFREWAGYAADIADCQDGNDALDIATGTGILARIIRERNDVRVTGIDINEGMIETARRVAPELEWVVGSAEELPFEDDTFDRVVCQYGLMFFPDQAKGVREMARVLRPGGRCVISTWDQLERLPVLQVLVDLLRKYFNEEIAVAMGQPFSLGEKSDLEKICREAGVDDFTITSTEGWVRFESVRAWLHTVIMGWIAKDHPVELEIVEKLILEGEERLAHKVGEDGRFVFEQTGHWIVFEG